MKISAVETISNVCRPLDKKTTWPGLVINIKGCLSFKLRDKLRGSHSRYKTAEEFF